MTTYRIPVPARGLRQPRSADIAAERPLATPLGLGVALFLVSEAFLFGTLFIIYYYLRGQGHLAWPPAGVELHLSSAVVNTLVLLSSSVAISLGARAIRRGRVRTLALSLGATIGLGVVFLAVKLSEWGSNSFSPASHAYGSIYYTLTGFHALHIVIGLIILTALLIRTLAGRVSAQRHLAVELGSLCWPSGAAVAILVFLTISVGR